MTWDRPHLLLFEVESLGGGNKMPSKNSHVYYKRFLRCVDQRYAEDKNRLIEAIFDELIKKAPSLAMGGSGWLDTFFCEAARIICSGSWCHDDHCKDNNGGYPYNCRAGNIPSRCKIWKSWRLQWRSFPEKEECQKRRYFKPYDGKSAYTAAAFGPMF
jgi:hypothetical protein